MEREERSSSWMIWETVFPDWDNGRGLGVVYGEDSFRKLTPEELLEEQQKEDINQDTDMGMNMGM